MAGKAPAKASKVYEPGTVVLFPKPDPVEGRPYTVDRDRWLLTGAMLAGYAVTRTEDGVEIRHQLDDCTALVALLTDGTELADAISRLADHICGRPARD